jgi:hypothetical protein
MAEIGLIPSDTGERGGKHGGQNMSHYIEPGGWFQKAFGAPAARGFDPLGVELRDDADARKTRFTYPDGDQNAWARPDATLICGACNVAMEASEAETG